MAQKPSPKSCRMAIFSPDTPRITKIRKSVFFIIFCLIILLQAFYWLCANSVTPIVLGLPFGMFFITLLIAVEFIMLLVLYYMEAREMQD